MIISSMVVLPAPFGPTRAATAPAGTSSVQSRSPHTLPQNAVGWGCHRVVRAWMASLR